MNIIWADTEIQLKYEKLEFHGLFNGNVFQKIKKWDIRRPHKFDEFVLPKLGV